MERIIIMIVFCLLLSTRGFSQDRKEIHYLADTLSTDKSNRILEIGKEASFTYYMFFCPCVPPYGMGYNLSFASYKEDKITFSDSLPKFDFLSWKELSKLGATQHADFNGKFKFFITELLPDKKYLTREVRIVHYREPIRDFTIIPPR